MKMHKVGLCDSLELEWATLGLVALGLVALGLVVSSLVALCVHFGDRVCKGYFFLNPPITVLH